MIFAHCGGGGGPTFGKDSQIISFFLRAYLSNLHTFVLIQIPSVTRTENTTYRCRQYCIFHQEGMRQHERLARDMSFHWPDMELITRTPVEARTGAELAARHSCSADRLPAAPGTGVPWLEILSNQLCDALLSDDHFQNHCVCSDPLTCVESESNGNIRN